MEFSVIVIGCGLAGAVAAEQLAAKGETVIVAEQRNHIGGNCYDSYNKHGILIHNYGPHIFHTDYEDVWKYLSRFTEWVPYQHRVLGLIDGRYVPIPFNLNSIKKLFPASLTKNLEEKLIDFFGFGKKIPILDLKQVNDPELQNLADYVYEKVFLGYTQKQWGLRPDEIDPQVTARVPVIISQDDRYFQDQYQGIPREGYTRMFENLLNHPNIKLMLNAPSKELLQIDEIYKKFLVMGREFNGYIIYTGPLDELFDYRYGMLPYRSLDFQWETFDQDFCQHTAVINYPLDYDYTRSTEYKHLTNQAAPKTTISYEYPKPYTANQDIPYYPILNSKNKNCYLKYKELANSYSNLYCLGRLAEFKYYDMDDIIKKCLQSFDRK